MKVVVFLCLVGVSLVVAENTDGTSHRITVPKYKIPSPTNCDIPESIREHQPLITKKEIEKSGDGVINQMGSPLTIYDILNNVILKPYIEKYTVQNKVYDG
ncbi:unnamed protein product [Nezara viridula]|uniref:Neuropeptide n=1 Tax=Nezara viridula TaxID=85310 RepID=A0A9P0HSL6_NEZVI|nr:unnamed protein product [Nezara viridula]